MWQCAVCKQWFQAIKPNINNQGNQGNQGGLPYEKPYLVIPTNPALPTQTFCAECTVQAEQYVQQIEIENEGTC